MTRAITQAFGSLSALLLAAFSCLSAQNTPNQENTPSASSPAHLVASWDFESDDVRGTWQKADRPGIFDQTKQVVAGPRAPRYPAFSDKNRAAYFNGKGLESALNLDDNGPKDVSGKDSLRFEQGETITLEAWVRPDGKNGEQYLIGKGRLNAKKFGGMNQNYGLRVRTAGSGLSVGFIFASHDGQGKNREWHVWWSDGKIPVSSNWQHVAVTYTFGKPESLRAYLNGMLASGEWTFAGPTTRPPVTDEDGLALGTGNERNEGNSLKGWLDNARIWRGAVPEAELKKRYAYVPGPPPAFVGQLQPGKVLVQICSEGVPGNRTWPEEEPKEEMTYFEDAFGFFEMPHRYVSTGIRGDRDPAMLRAVAKVALPKGKHRLLLRARGGSRLMIDGKVFLNTAFPRGDTGGHGRTADQDNYLNLGPDFRFAPPGNAETWAEFETAGGEHLFHLETIVGVGTMRPELGETVVAISLEGQESWSLLSAGTRNVAYTDAGWETYEKERRLKLHEQNRQNRQKAFASKADYWKKRRELAQAWLKETPEVPVPDLPLLADGRPAYEALNPIDHFIAHKIALTAKDYEKIPSDGVDYYKDIQPILEAQCYDCHQGEKSKGGLDLRSLQHALKGGKSDGPAITPGEPQESSLLARILSEDEDEMMPPKGGPLPDEQKALIKQWIEEGAVWPEFNLKNLKPTALTDDLTFLRRVSLDTVGVVPSEAEIREFLADNSPDKRSKAIDRYLNDPRWADHWTSYWQDVLAENPNIINPTLNNTGPFRWWIYEALLDNKPLDLFVTELVSLEGSDRFGGTRGFGTASQNDAPMAEKGAIVASAFLGVEMKCARCHDAPAHVSLQKDLFSLAAMLNRGVVKVPTTSSVPMDKLHEGGRKPLIQVTLAPGSDVKPEWPFARYLDAAQAVALAEDPENTREVLAAAITHPANQRFAQVIVNRLWQRLMGRGLVDQVADWERATATHPELLAWLGREFVRTGYDLKVSARLILNSHAYQRAVDPTLDAPSPLYVAPAPRRLHAEQIVDSLFAATGKPFKLEEVSLDLDGNRSYANSITLGKPTRSWMLASTSNERDRPSLTLPRIQAVSTVLEAFGWRGARQDPISVRELSPNTLQPAILANGTMGKWLTTLSDDHGITALALENQSLDQFIHRLFLKLLTRAPSAEEVSTLKQMLESGYESRIQEVREVAAEAQPRKRPYYFTWSNHLDGLANTLGVQAEERARRGDPPTQKLEPVWRENLEDVLWTMLNQPEWLFLH